MKSYTRSVGIGVINAIQSNCSIVDLKLEGSDYKGATTYKVIDHIAPDVVRLIVLAPDSPTTSFELGNHSELNLCKILAEIKFINLQDSSELMINFFDDEGPGAFCHKHKNELMA